MHHAALRMACAVLGAAVGLGLHAQHTAPDPVAERLMAALREQGITTLCAHWYPAAGGASMLADSVGDPEIDELLQLFGQEHQQDMLRTFQANWQHTPAGQPPPPYLLYAFNPFESPVYMNGPARPIKRLGCGDDHQA